MTEKEQMLMSILHCRRADLYAGNIVLGEKEEKLLQQMQVRRANGEPLQYILQETEFLGLPLRVEEGVFIPRPETEILVDFVVQKIRSGELDTARPLRVLDIGTGTGNIAVTLAHMLEQTVVTAVDVSSRALLNAYKNAGRHNVHKRVSFIQSNLFSNLSSERVFDVIVTNPPYIARRDLPDLPADVQKEPQTALDGGVDGLDFYRRILNEARYHLVPGALLACEVGAGQRDEIFRMMKNSKVFEDIEFYKDLAGVDRVAIAVFQPRQKFGLEQMASMESRG